MSLKFCFGVMGSGKSARMLMELYAYDKKHALSFVIKPRIDTRTELIASRVLHMNPRKADLIVDPGDTIDIAAIMTCAKFVFVDEAQFLSRAQVDSLWLLSMDIPVVCFGLRTDFQGHMFEGSQRLMEVCDELEQIKGICDFCDRPATWNLRLVNGTPVFDGPQVQIGADESYAPCCKHCVVQRKYQVQE